MARFLASRFVAMVGIVLVLTAVLFVLQQVSPTDPVRVMVGANASPEQVQAAREELGLDKPVIEQYGNYLWGLLHGDLQTSYTTRRPVGSDLATFLPATVELALFGLFVAVGLGAIIGITAGARWRGSGLVGAISVAGAAIPPFLVVLLGLVFFFRHLGWLPSSGRTDISDAPDGPSGLLVVDGILAGRLDVVVDAFHHLILPGVAIALGAAVAFGRVLRSSLRNTLRSDYVRTARAKGMRESRVVFRHGIRNSAGPALSMLGLQVGLMLAGVIVVEQIVSWPGIGRYAAVSIPRADFPAIAGVTLLLGVAYVVTNALVDILQAAADPRIRA